MPAHQGKAPPAGTLRAFTPRTGAVTPFLAFARRHGLDARNKSGHDGEESSAFPADRQRPGCVQRPGYSRPRTLASISNCFSGAPQNRSIR